MVPSEHSYRVAKLFIDFLKDCFRNASNICAIVYLNVITKLLIARVTV